ncbi:sulfite oxidase-like oxidoreductase [soil metagenome]
MSLRKWWPRRAPGLPPGQRLLQEMPRFSDRPKRWPPRVPTEPGLTVSFGDDIVTTTTVDALAEHPRAEERVHDFHCVTGWSVRELRWRGVPLAALMADMTDAIAMPPFARVHAHDGLFAVSHTEDLLDPRTLVATHLDDQPLDARHGAPLRLVTPHLYGYKNVKHLRAIEFVADEPASMLGAKEHPRARIEHEERHRFLPNWLVRTPYRLAIPYVARLAEQSLDGRLRSSN